MGGGGVESVDFNVGHGFALVLDVVENVVHSHVGYYVRNHLAHLKTYRK